jgi:AcrR family transcriptional regulator
VASATYSLPNDASNLRLDKHERSFYGVGTMDGSATKARILDAGLDMASLLGLECVTIGGLAKVTEMSKSGLFAHFRSKENLQLDILEHSGERFVDEVLGPALKVQRGIPRIRALFENWAGWSSGLRGGCVFVAASSEYSDRQGRVREKLLEFQTWWIESLSRVARSAVVTGEFREDADCGQFAYEFYSLMLGFYLYDRLLHEPDLRRRQRTALDRLIAGFR